MQMGGKTAWFLGFTALGDVEDLKLLLGGRDAASSTLVNVFSSSLTLFNANLVIFLSLCTSSLGTSYRSQICKLRVATSMVV